ncbi:uncharacterized protein LOC117787511 [Drosophila innubila]|uniref:uncharacterized protein LOC117787511 n=1 Tax=Drosophila innubila TaxID=198719 RepID=UPI00148C22A6|nr:uncharacterized protein LOC117787511 [Drosophila innubila]
MSQNPKPIDEYLAEMDDDNDSFQSMNQSEVFSDDLENLSSLDDDDTLTDEHEFELENILVVKGQGLALEADSSNSSAENGRCLKNIDKMLNSGDGVGVVRTRTDSARSLKPSNCQSPKWMTARRAHANHYLVPELRCDSPMPAMELFDMNNQKKEINVKEGIKQQGNERMEKDQKDMEALQKFAFTEIWVERQQNNPEDKRSVRGKFTADLEKYFLKENTKQFKSLTLEEQKKGEINKKLFLDPTQSSTARSTSFHTVQEPYVSPFEDLPVVPGEKKLQGEKSYITVPAGYDLTNLVKYNNPNHWHRRPTTRNDSNP